MYKYVPIRYQASPVLSFYCWQSLNADASDTSIRSPVRLRSHAEQSNDASKSANSGHSSAATTLIKSDEIGSDDSGSDDGESDSESDFDAKDGDSEAESVDTGVDVADPHPPVQRPLSSYEQQKLANIERNKGLLKDIEEAAAKLREDMQAIKKKKTVRHLYYALELANVQPFRPPATDVQWITSPRRWSGTYQR